MKTEEIEKLIIDWLKSGNENTTYIANQISSLFKQPIAEGITVPYQLCPKCHGDGNLSRYNSPALASTTCAPICDVCNGSKIIPTLPLSVNMPSQDEIVKHIEKVTGWKEGGYELNMMIDFSNWLRSQITLKK